ncbi:MAG: aminodeoxychorismate/anthranilate synthase component II [Euryarchaeota archaeon RBG_16_68_13]|nr:MAG: aminodeoxychorismate/anthranilate synthase component II [Euryarchaeota archaeon RBG_16_68_13]
MRVLVIDNYDSFVYNLYQRLGELGADPVVHRNDAITVEEIRRIAPDAIVLSPGPGHPVNARDFGICGNVLRDLGPSTPTLGVCLGHQGIGTTFGGTVDHAARLLHGKTSRVTHDGRTIFEGLPNPIVAGRYHSLAILRERLPPDLEISATADDGEIMAVRHRVHPIEGVQFHPESILTPEGPALLRNFLKGARR